MGKRVFKRGLSMLLVAAIVIATAIVAFPKVQAKNDNGLPDQIIEIPQNEFNNIASLGSLHLKWYEDEIWSAVEKKLGALFKYCNFTGNSVSSADWALIDPNLNGVSAKSDKDNKITVSVSKDANDLLNDDLTFMLKANVTCEYKFKYAPSQKRYVTVTIDLCTITLKKSEVVTPKVHTVTFNDGYSNTPIDIQSVAHGLGAMAPANPSRHGYVFLGWDISFDNITGDTTVTARWREAEVTTEATTIAPTTTTTTAPTITTTPVPTTTTTTVPTTTTTTTTTTVPTTTTTTSTTTASTPTTTTVSTPTTTTEPITIENVTVEITDSTPGSDNIPTTDNISAMETTNSIVILDDETPLTGAVNQDDADTSDNTSIAIWVAAIITAWGCIRILKKKSDINS